VGGVRVPVMTPFTCDGWDFFEDRACHRFYATRRGADVEIFASTMHTLWRWVRWEEQAQGWRTPREPVMVWCTPRQAKLEHDLGRWQAQS
jgi:hypothetical protein